jgi:hypothetical protein
MSLRRIQRELVGLLHERGRDDLARDALDRVAYTDDGSTVYVHVFAKPSWPRRRPGQAYPLAFADHDQLGSLTRHRELLRDAHLLLGDEIGDIVNWFDG